MAGITLYHNPKCSKSRGAKEILEAAGAEFEVVEYLKAPLSAAELEELLGLLHVDPAALVRKDSRFKELGLNADDYTTTEAVAALLADHPELMQRPVAVRETRAVIARPAERVAELL